MQVLIKRIQKKRSQFLLCGYVGEGHLGGLTSPPHLPVPCGASALFPRFATEPPSCTCVPQHQEKPSGQRDGRGLRGTQLIFFHHPSSHPCQAKLSRPSLRREMISVIYTLRPWNQRLSLWAVGVRGLWGSSWQQLLRFFHLIATWLRKRQKGLGAVPHHHWGSELAFLSVLVKQQSWQFFLCLCFFVVYAFIFSGKKLNNFRKIPWNLYKNCRHCLWHLQSSYL